MKVTETKLKGCFIIEPEIFKDERGYFFESFNKRKFHQKTGVEIDFVQDNVSISKYGVIRGLHMQKEPFAQSKLIQVLNGKILDVAVDMRVNSLTYKEVFSIELSSKNAKQLFIPKGFLHGFSVLEENTIVSYKVDNYYNKEAEVGVNYKDEIFSIDWLIDSSKVILSSKDKILYKTNNL